MGAPDEQTTASFRFDVPTGVATDSQGARMMLVPCATLAMLTAGAPDVLAAVGRGVGTAAGARAVARLGGAPVARALDFDDVIFALAAELSVAGVGLFSFERWGRSLVAVVRSAPVTSAPFLESLVASALSTLGGRDVHGVALSDAHGVWRVLAASRDATRRVRSLLAQKVAWAEALTRLHDGAAP